MELLVRGGRRTRRARRVSTSTRAPIDAAAHHASARRRVNAVLGTTLDAEDVLGRAARRSGIELDEASVDPTATRCRGPAVCRPDLEREIDLVEEVARRIGFDHIGRTVPGEPRAGRRADACASGSGVRWPTRSSGSAVSEAITLSLVAPADLERAGAPVDRLVRASNPLRAEESVLRTRVLARAVAGGRLQPRARPARRRALRAGSRVPRAGRRRRPVARRARAPRDRAVRRRAPQRRSRPTGASTCTTRSTRCGWSPTRSASTTSPSSRRRRRGFRAGAPRVSSSAVSTSGVVGELAPDVLSARPHRPGGRGRGRARRARRRATA